MTYLIYFFAIALVAVWRELGAGMRGYIVFSFSLSLVLVLIEGGV
jgi:hypothetical protein